MAFSILLNELVDYQRETPAPDAAGGVTMTFPTVLTDVEASIRSAGTSTILRYAQRNITISHKILVDLDMFTAVTGGVKPGDRLVQGSTTYVIKGWDEQDLVMSGQPLSCLLCEQLIPGVS